MATPVLVLTARDAVPDRIRGLNLGADDYVVKPFGSDQLDARMRAVLRRTQAVAAEGPIVVGALTINAGTRVASLGDEILDLSRKEFDLLHLLAQHKGQVVTKRDILAEVWRHAYGGAERTVDVHLSWLRRKLGDDAREPRRIKTVWGRGYQFNPAAWSE